MTGVLTDSGFACLRHRHTSVNTGTTTRLRKDIKEGKYDLIWVEFPVQGFHVKHEQYFAHMSQLCLWASLSAKLGNQFIIFGSTGTKRDDPQIQVPLSLPLGLPGARIDVCSETLGANLLCTGAWF